MDSRSAQLLPQTSIFAQPAEEVAGALLGSEIHVGKCAGRIVEVEWYDQDDPASHSFRGVTPRCQTMFGPPGRLYVYRSYGIHWCTNVVCDGEGRGAAVLLRALEPIRGRTTMAERRGTDDSHLLCAGPGRLSQALGIDGSFDGESLDGPRARIVWNDEPQDVVVGPRIGISVAKDRPWRHGIAGSRYLSRPFPKEVPSE